VILGVVGWGALAKYVLPEPPQAAARDERLGLATMRMQARYYVGAHAVAGSALYEQAQALNTGPVSQRLRFIVLAGELRDPIEARHQLRHLDALAKEHLTYTPGRTHLIAQVIAAQGLVSPGGALPVVPQAAVALGVVPFDALALTYTPEQLATRNRLARLYGDYERLHFDAPSLTRQDREQLRQALGWFGELALAPDGRRFTERVVLAPAGVAAAGVLQENALPDPQARTQALAPALRTFWVLVAAGGSACLLGVAGLAGLITFLVLLIKGYVRSHFECGVTRGGVYAETFALWLVLFMAMPLLGLLLPREAPRLLLSGAAALLSLVALGWPVLRGIPWRQVRADIGLTAGDRPAVEPLCGLTAYGISLPLLAVGLLLTFVLTLMERALTGGGGSGFEPTTGPAHPIVLDVVQGDFWARLQVLLLACVVAPLVEETMFRGVLYRHLREATCGLSRGLSFFLSATVVSFLFAVIHPQGLIAIPALMSLAYAFAIAREWRGTLLPAMVAHGVNNGLVMLLVLFALGD
jgi:membrane protease YdiL (CAAX protease family)